MRPADDQAYDPHSLELEEEDSYDAQAVDSQLDSDYITYSAEHDYEYTGAEHDGDMPDDAMYDDDDFDDDFDDELSSSPSIPDENINFDLVYALHTFIATVDGQATVQKGDHLVLLDDSNSYWWLVRVMPSQEVGYIPAENIETPYERLARLNKHRNVEIATATEEDTEPMYSEGPSGFLVKARTYGGINKHSGKLSALSRREVSHPDEEHAQRSPPKKQAVLFGQSEYVEHSGNEASDEEDEEAEEHGEEESAVAYEGRYEYDAASVEDEGDENQAPAVMSSTPIAGEAPRLASTSASTISPTIGLYPTSDDDTSREPREETRRSKRTSLLGMPGTEKTFTVVRLFAGDTIQSDATFKTVLLSPTTTASELLRQAMQRFHLTEDENDYAVVLRHADGDEQTLESSAYPLQMLEALADHMGNTSHNDSSQHDSVTSLMSLVDTSSSRIMFDYSDDRYGKLFLVRRTSSLDDVDKLLASTPALTAMLSPSAPVTSPTKAKMAPSPSTPAAAPASDTLLRFTVQLALDAPDLPEGLYFDATSGVPMRGSPPPDQAPSLSQTRLLQLVKNATVAEVIEAGLEAFQVPDAVVDGGDDVEARAWHGRPRAKYRLVAQSGTNEQSLSPTSKVLAAYDTLPRLHTIEVASKRKSLDLAITPGSMDDIASTDPVFVLRLVPPERPFGAGSATDTSILSTSRSFPSDPFGASSSRPTPSALLSPRATRPAVLANGESGVDLIVSDQVRLRSSRANDSPRVRYSLLSAAGSSRDVSEALQPVLEGITNTHGTRSMTHDDLLERFAEQIPTMPETTVKADLHLLMRGLVLDKSHSSPSSSSLPPLSTPPPTSSSSTSTRRSPLSSSALSKATASAPLVTPLPDLQSGLHLPSQAQLQRSSSVRSVSASDAAMAMDTPARTSAPSRRTGDRVLSDSTVATGTDRQGHEKYNFHALYGIVDALVMEKPQGDVDQGLSSSHHLSPPSSPQTGALKRSSFAMSKLLEETPAERVWRESNGLFSVPFQSAETAPAGAEDEHLQFAPLMARIAAVEADLDDQLRALVGPSVSS
ncbi:hypothetical protein ACI68E_001505 [Malassezia pachydermatis]|uniref:SH3 domain-containing protein n=1 Tax=Malassezia pachydermatis TaxID=77020 RepID=A0A0M8MSF9_9BASI|nr:hypothetical protein Malapachy_3242 [Malassezia pachydermatis]KOS15847.1 hypothetical protein Malapachy_3242 [Malassezia pachydermatis]